MRGIGVAFNAAALFVPRPISSYLPAGLFRSSNPNVAAEQLSFRLSETSRRSVK